MRFWIAACVVAFAPTASSAQVVNCEALQHTKVPFELKMRAGERNFLTQIYRSDDLYRVQYVGGVGSATKQTFQGNFQKTMRRADGTSATSTWSVPTNRYFWDQNVRFAEVSYDERHPEYKEKNTFRMLNDDVVTLGPCIIPVKHYSVERQSKLVSVNTEIWFSPDLQAVLKIVGKDISGKKEVVNQSEANDVSLDFTPMH